MIWRELNKENEKRMGNACSTSFIFLQNNDRWNQLLKFDIVSGSLSEVPRPIRGVRISGHYKKWLNSYVMFYRKQSALYFQVEGKKILLENSDCIMQFKREGHFNLFQIIAGEKTIFEHQYESLLYDSISEIDPDFNDEKEEDQDFYLFVFNVMNDNERRNRIYTNSTFPA